MNILIAISFYHNCYDVEIVNKDLNFYLASVRKLPSAHYLQQIQLRYCLRYFIYIVIIYYYYFHFQICYIMSNYSAKNVSCRCDWMSETRSYQILSMNIISTLYQLLRWSIWVRIIRFFYKILDLFRIFSSFRFYFSI